MRQEPGWRCLWSAGHKMIRSTPSRWFRSTRLPCGRGRISCSKHRMIRYDQRGASRSTVRSDPGGVRARAVEPVRAFLGRYPDPALRGTLSGAGREAVLVQLRDRAGRGLKGDGEGSDGPQPRACRKKGWIRAHGFLPIVSMLPGRLGDCRAHRLMALVWRNYFDPSSSAPPPEGSWLDDIRSKPMLETRRATVEAEAS